MKRDMVKHSAFTCSMPIVFGLLETPAEVSGQGYEASSDTTSAQGQCASISSDPSVNRASTSADLSRLGYLTNSFNTFSHVSVFTFCLTL